MLVGLSHVTGHGMVGVVVVVGAALDVGDGEGEGGGSGEDDEPTHSGRGGGEYFKFLCLAHARHLSTLHSGKMRLTNETD